MTSCVHRRISSALCSTQPGAGKICSCSLRHGHDARVLVKYHEARAGCSLVDRPDVTLHLSSPLHVARSKGQDSDAPSASRPTAMLPDTKDLSVQSGPPTSRRTDAMRFFQFAHL